ncbi:MAG: hypothetical protein OEV78_07280 [Spirochaetia bacterium]|nr:hypothetical protein [Spirochaetia bacterium]
MVKLLTRILILHLTIYAMSIYGQAGDEPAKAVETPQIQNNTEEITPVMPAKDIQPAEQTQPAHDKAQVKPEKKQPEEKAVVEEVKNNKTNAIKKSTFSLGLNAGYGGSIVKLLTSKGSPFWLNSLNITVPSEHLFNDMFSLYWEVGYHHGLLTNVKFKSANAVNGIYTEQDSLSTVEANVIFRYYLPELFGRLKFFAGLGFDVGYMTYFIEVPQVDYIVDTGVESVKITTSAGSFHGTGIFLGASSNLGVKYKIEDNLDLHFITKFNYNFLSKLSWGSTDKTTDLTHMEISFSFGPMMRF